MSEELVPLTPVPYCVEMAGQYQEIPPAVLEGYAVVTPPRPVILPDGREALCLMPNTVLRSIIIEDDR